MSTSVGGKPQSIANLKNCSIATDTFESTFNVTLFPARRAPNNWRQGISIGKLKGAMIDTGP